MTGMYLRVRRDNKWHNLEVEHLTPEELELIFNDRLPDELVNWIKALSKVIADVEPIVNAYYDAISDMEPA